MQIIIPPNYPQLLNVWCLLVYVIVIESLIFLSMTKFSLDGSGSETQQWSQNSSWMT